MIFFLFYSTFARHYAHTQTTDVGTEEHGFSVPCIKLLLLLAQRPIRVYSLYLPLHL
jgi:hypothetical protein